MSRHIAWDRRAIDDLRAIIRRDRRLGLRIKAAVEQYAEQDIGDARKLSGASDEYRLRVGDWRVLYRLEVGGRILTVSRVLNRRDAYR